jgi:membrane protein
VAPSTRMPGAMRSFADPRGARVRALLARLQATKPLRTWSRLNDSRGAILAAGIAFFGFFSLVPALTLGFTAFGFVLGGSESLQRKVAQRINEWVGFTLIGTSPGSGVVQLSDLVQQDVLTLTGVFGLVSLVFAGLGWLKSTREGIRVVFGAPTMTNYLLARVRDLASLLLLGLVVLASLVTGVVVATGTGAVTGWLGWDGTPLGEATVSVGSSVVLLVLDMAILLLFLTVLSDVPVPVADLRSGAVLGALGMQVLNYSAGLVVHRVSHNPLLASSVVVVGLLVWMNLAARVTLLTAAWAATTAADRGHLDTATRAGPQPEGEVMTRLSQRNGTQPSQPSQPSRVASSRARSGARSPRARRAEPIPATFGQRSADRTTLAAGMVLGAGVLMALRVVRRALVALYDAVRG